MYRPSDNQDKFPLHRAVLEKDYDTLVELIAKINSLPNGSDRKIINQQDQDGKTVLNLAASVGCDTFVMVILNASPDVDLPDNLGNTPLHNSLERWKQRMVEVQKAPMLPNTQAAKVAIDQRLSYDCISVMELLLKKNANAKVLNQDNKSAYEIAHNLEVDDGTISDLFERYDRSNAYTIT